MLQQIWITSEKKLKIRIEGDIVTNIRNLKKQSTDKDFPMFHVELKPESNNKDIYEIRLLL